MSDGFRMPIVGKIPASGESLRVWLKGFRESQGCFVKVENGSIVVRHGGFWDLRVLEPSEDILRPFEVLPHHGLDDYANFAYALCDAAMPVEPSGLPFFDTLQVPLTRFDPKPIQDSYVALAAFGQMTDQQRVHILSGGYVDLYKNVRDETHPIQTYSVTYLKARNGKNVPFYTPQNIGVEGLAQGWDEFVNTSAAMSPFFNGTPSSLELKLLESFWYSAWYRRLWGDSPDDIPQFDEKYGTVIGIHAHYLRLLGSPLPTETLAPDRVLTGSFRFFASISDQDGVENLVTIPDSKH